MTLSRVIHDDERCYGLLRRPDGSRKSFEAWWIGDRFDDHRIGEFAVFVGSSFSLARFRNLFRCEAQSIHQRVHGLAQLHCGLVHPKIVEVAYKLKENRERLKLCLPLTTPVKGPQ